MGRSRRTGTVRTIHTLWVVLALVVGACAVAEDSSSSTTRVSAETSSTAGGECEIPDGRPLADGVSVPMQELGESEGVRLEGAVYPHPDYEGNPWSQWGQGIVLPDGRFISAIGDHIGRDGNSYVFEYDPGSGSLTTIADALSFTDHVAGSWGFGKIHSQMVPGPCGEIYFSTYWGTSRDLEFDANYNGDLLMRLDPYGRTLAPLKVPVEKHGQASLASSSGLGLVYGEAVDPVYKAEGVDRGPFFVYDLDSEQVIFTGPEVPHEGFRNILLDQDGRAYYSIGGGALAVYDPETNSESTHGESMPGAVLRASTSPGPDGRVFGATVDPDAFFVMHPDGDIEDLGRSEGYTTSMALSPTDNVFYYMPDAHGSAWESGAPLIAVDIDSGEQTIVIEVNDMVENGLGYTVGGTYNVAVSPDGETVYLGVNASPLGDDSGFGEVILLAVHLR